MNEKMYFRQCNLFFISNLALALFAVGISCIMIDAISVWPICWGMAFLVGVIYVILKQKSAVLSEKEKELHRSFLPVHIGIVSLLLAAVVCLYFRIELYSINSSQVLDHRDVWGNVLLTTGVCLIVCNIVGAGLVTWLEKQLYKIKFK